jgi:2',3'-cyclic-nucleotide 2'-phosphodiesterase (5'-nucleotidase family)
MTLNEKQTAKVAGIIGTVDLTAATAALATASKNPSLANIKATRKAVAKELRTLDKALAVADIDIAFDEAKALVAKKTAKA